jgi:curved DNA-binding protein CbpA
VKLYHPDRRHHTSGDGIPHPTKLERYRLVVAANEILSNPHKRRMYDIYGIGWVNESDPRARYRAADRAWRQAPGNASMNATWEDWERWRQQRDGNGGKQEPIFTSNGAFASIILLFMFIGSWGHITRAGARSMHALDMREERHAAISRDIRRRQSKTAGLNREGRVQTFLRQRELENWTHDLPGQAISAGSGPSNRYMRQSG